MWAMRDISERENAKQIEQELHRQQIETARIAGMSEFATGVLHNVGNALNSVNVSANYVRDTLSDSKINRVSDLAELLNDQTDLPEFFSSDSRGERVPAYLDSLGQEFLSEHDSNKNEINQLLSHIQHIKAVVATQQSIAKPIGLVEDVQIADLVDESLGIHIGPKDHATIKVFREYEELPHIRVDRARIMQILFNLMRNAKESVRDSRVEDPQLHVAIKRLADAEVVISVRDNGLGIEKEQLDRIFSHGFTTKSYGHGFGLHASANAATEMGGSLAVFSDGLGKGATFKLTIPLVTVSEYSK